MEQSDNNSSESLYLKQLTYSKKAGKTFLNFFIKNFKITVMIVVGILVWGVYSLFLLPLESTPEVKIPYGIVSVALPGASPADMEELVIDKIESKILNLQGVKTVRSNASNSFASISVEFRAEEDITDAIRRLRDAVETTKSELPTEASDPNVMEVSFSNIPVWTISVTGPYDSFTLRRYAEKVQTELKKLPGASDVTISGGDIYEVRVIYDPQKLQLYNLTADTVNSIIKANNFGLPSGSLNVSSYSYSVRVDGKLSDASDLRNMSIIAINNDLVRLSDVADVIEMARERTVFNTFSVEGGEPQNAVTLNIVKRTGSSIITLIDNGKIAVEKIKQDFPADVAIVTTLDTSEMIRTDINHLLRDGLLTVFIVTFILFLFVGLKEAFVAGLAVPLVFCVTFGMMNLIGLSINFLSLFSLILSLGLLVDDAIVVVQATKQYLATGKFTPEEAVLLVFRDYKILLTATTLITIWAFIPLVLASGIIGSFIRSIPLTVSITLAASYVIAIIINHPMAIILERFRVTRSFFIPIMVISGLLVIGMIYALATGSLNVYLGLTLIVLFAVLFFGLVTWYRTSLKRILIDNEEKILEELADDNKIKAKIHHHYLAAESEKTFFSRMINGVVKMDRILPGYGRVLYSLLASKFQMGLVLVVALLLFLGSVSLPASGILKSEFIPPADEDNMYINITGPAGLVTERTLEISDKVTEILLKEPDIESFSLIVGAGGVATSGSFSSAGASTQSNKAQFAVTLYPFDERPVKEKSYDIARRIRDSVSGIQEAKVEVVEIAGGPPSGADFQGDIKGDDLKVLEERANRYRDLLAMIPGTVNIKTSLDISPGEFSINLDNDRMQLRGITSAQVASILRTALSGSDVTKILKEGDDLQIRSVFREDSIDSIDDLRSMQIANGRGQVFQLGDIADISLGSSLTAIAHQDGKRVVTVTASVVKPQLPTVVLQKFQELQAKEPLPEGYEISYGGQSETNTESIYSILRAMLVAMLLIVATLVLQFNSFKKSILVLSTIPLAITGVFYGLTLIGLTLTFPALIGVLSLFGVVVKNAVILVDKINLNLKVGIGFDDSIVDAAKSRLEAIFLTSICTIFGMVPITLTDETWAGLGASLIFGLSFSTLLTLLVIPIIFKLLIEKDHKKDEKLRRLKENVAMRA